MNLLILPEKISNLSLYNADNTKIRRKVRDLMLNLLLPSIDFCSAASDSLFAIKPLEAVSFPPFSASQKPLQRCICFSTPTQNVNRKTTLTLSLFPYLTSCNNLCG